MADYDTQVWLDRIRIFCHFVRERKEPYNGFLSYQWIENEALSWYPSTAKSELARRMVASAERQGIRVFTKKVLKLPEFIHNPQDGNLHLRSVLPGYVTGRNAARTEIRKSLVMDETARRIGRWYRRNDSAFE